MSLLRINEDTGFEGPHQPEKIVELKSDAGNADAGMILIHGRGASAESIIGLSGEFNTQKKMHYRAPQAAGFTWYPYSFLAPTEQNEPGLTSGLQKIFDLVAQFESEGIPKERIYLLGFSQGACLTAEFVARHPAKYAGVILLSGGLIGESVVEENYTGDLENTPVFMGCSDVDPHIPKERVDESESVFVRLGAAVTKKIYTGMGHTVIEDEINHINEMLNM